MNWMPEIGEEVPLQILLYSEIIELFLYSMAFTHLYHIGTFCILNLGL
jgi:hypothetical protein